MDITKISMAKFTLMKSEFMNFLSLFHLTHYFPLHFMPDYELNLNSSNPSWILSVKFPHEKHKFWEGASICLHIISNLCCAILV